MSDVEQGGVPGRGYRKIREGYVVSDKMDKTVVVIVEDRVKHPKYGKVIRRTKKYTAHDGENACGVGDRVRLMETRPLSATKRWRVVGDPGEGQVVTTAGADLARTPASGSRS